MNVVITNTCSIFFQIRMTSYIKMNIVGKQKNLTPEIFLYVLEMIFIVNLKKKIYIFGDTIFMNFKVKVKVTGSST